MCTNMCLLSGPGSRVYPNCNENTYTQLWVSKYYYSLPKKEPGILPEMAHSRAGTGKDKTILKYLVEPERKAEFKE